MAQVFSMTICLVYIYNSLFCDHFLQSVGEHVCTFFFKCQNVIFSKRSDWPLKGELFESQDPLHVWCAWIMGMQNLSCISVIHHLNFKWISQILHNEIWTFIGLHQCSCLIFDFSPAEQDIDIVYRPFFSNISIFFFIYLLSAHPRCWTFSRTTKIFLNKSVATLREKTNKHLYR